MSNRDAFLRTIGEAWDTSLPVLVSAYSTIWPNRFDGVPPGELLGHACATIREVVP